MQRLKKEAARLGLGGHGKLGPGEARFAGAGLEDRDWGDRGRRARKARPLAKVPILSIKIFSLY